MNLFYKILFNMDWVAMVAVAIGLIALNVWFEII